MKNTILFLSILILGFLGFGCQEGSTDISTNPTSLEKNASYYAEYSITLENLSPEGSQPFSPPILAVHSPNFRIFHIGDYASDEHAQVAQDAFNDPLINLLNNDAEVSDVVIGQEGPIFPGSAQSFTVMAHSNYSKLSLVTMLVNTNDGFTGVDKIQLPQTGSMTYYLRSYDAGSEENTEMTEHIPGPCCGSHFMGVATHQKITFHPGISGIGDLDPSVYGWKDPIAKLTVSKLN